ncbi:MAG: sugar phosphate isomerase/epimerase family protein [Candidatus Hydrogenedentota bacterium]
MSNAWSRRTFIKAASLAPVGAWAGLAARGAPAQQPIERVGDPKIKLSVNAYSFNTLLREGEMDLFDLLEYCAEAGFDAADPTGYYWPPGYPEVPTDEYIAEFKLRAHHLGLALSGTGVRNDFTRADAASREDDIELTKRWIQAAAKMGAPVIRVFAGHAWDAEEEDWDQVAEERVAPAFRECAAYGQEHGVIVAVQNHAHFLRSAGEILRIMELVDSPWFGLVCDTGSFITSDPYEDIAQVIPYAVNWQLKEQISGGDGGRERIDLVRLMTIVREQGYRGYMPLETLPSGGGPYDPHKQLRAFAEEAREAIAETA